MLETKEQKQIFTGCIALIVILLAVSFWHRPSQTVKNNIPNKQSNQNILASKAYLDYFAAANVDKEASKELFETILTKEDIKKEVEQTLQTDQKINPPLIKDNKIKILQNSSDEAVTEYLTQSISGAYNFSTSTIGLTQNLFDKDDSSKIKSQLAQLTQELNGLNVPKEAVGMHKALVSLYLSYDDLLNAGRQYDPENLDKNDEIWPQLYKNFTIINDNAATYNSELMKLTKKHNISLVPVNYYAKNTEKKGLSDIFIPKAHAFLGIGDITFSTTIGDIPRIIMDGIKEGIRTAFLNFTSAMLNKLITKIEQNYKIANFLYYTDALVSGQYADSYLTKYVTNPLDQKIVKNFLPQFCPSPDLAKVFEAKASNYLGFDPNNLDPNDSNYYKLMARVGDFYSSPKGWELHYQDLASQTQSQAQRSAEQELVSSGLKTPRDTIKSLLASSNSNLISAQRASFTALLQLGASNAESIISNVVAKLTETLVNNFIFQGVTGNSGNVAVLKEQPNCVTLAVANPILPVPPTQFVPPPPPLSAEEATSQNCVTMGLPPDCSQPEPPPPPPDTSMCGCQIDVRGDTIPGSCTNELSTQTSCP